MPTCKSCEGCGGRGGSPSSEAGADTELSDCQVTFPDAKACSTIGECPQCTDGSGSIMALFLCTSPQRSSLFGASIRVASGCTHMTPDSARARHIAASACSGHGWDAPPQDVLVSVDQLKCIHLANGRGPQGTRHPESFFTTRAQDRRALTIMCRPAKRVTAAPVGVTRPAGAQYALPSIEVYTASSRCPPLHKGSIGPDGRMSIKDELEARSESKTGNKS